MTIKIIHCPKWKSYLPKVASYAAAIRDEIGMDAEIELGKRGQFDVYVNERRVVSRKGGLMALITKKQSLKF